MRNYLGIDLGQSSVKVSALRPNGQVLGTVRRSYRTQNPGAGMAEQKPDDWVSATHEAIRALLGDVDAKLIAGIGLSAATHHAVLLDAEMRPVRPCILLSDGRSADQARRLDADHGDDILRLGRNRVTATWCLPQFIWLAENEPENWARTRHILFSKDYVRLSLTGFYGTDLVDAQGSLLVNGKTDNWDETLCRFAGVSPAALPPIADPAEITSHINAAGAQHTGLIEGTPVIAGCSDTAIEALSAGAVTDGDVIVKLATAGNVNLITSEPRVSRDWITYSYPIPGLAYHTQGTNSAATSLSWWQQMTQTPIEELLAESEEKANPAGDDVLFHPYLLGERSPHWNPNLRASLTGISAATERADITRAILQGVAYSLKDCFEAYGDRLHGVTRAAIIGGGARSALWRDLVADTLGIELTYPPLADASYGAALLAMSADRGLASVLELLDALEPVAVSHPGVRTRPDRYARFTEVREALAPLFSN